MLRNQMVRLNDLGEQFLTKALEAKGSTAKELTEAGLRCFEEARQIFMALASNSILLYFECAVQRGSRGNYSEYLDFCARNGLETISEVDFERFSLDIPNSKL